MRAIVMERFGEPDVLVEREIPAPEPEAGQILVRVVATSVNPVDAKIRRAGSWAVRPPVVIGGDVSGVVEAVGPGVRDFAVGDEVFYVTDLHTGGSYAEYTVADAHIVAKKPRNMSHEQAAAVPLAGATAWDALFVRADLRPWERVLVHGAVGGVGSFAVQLAHSTGAYVFGTCGEYNFDLASGIGVDRPIDYRAQNFVEVIDEVTDGRGVDVVLDTQGGDVLERSLSACAPHARVVTLIGGRIDLDEAKSKNIAVHAMMLERGRDKLDRLRVLIERGRVVAVEEQVLPLAKVAAAHRAIETNAQRRGKIILRVG